MDRAIAAKIADQAKRTGKELTYSTETSIVLEEFATERKSHVMAQYLAFRKRFEQAKGLGLADATVNEFALKEFDQAWKDVTKRLLMIPGKEALSAINKRLQDVYGVSVTPTAIVEAMHVTEVPADMALLINRLNKFAAVAV